MTLNTWEKIGIGAIGLVSVAALARAAQAPTPGQVFVGESYIISTDGANTYAMNGANGDVDFKGTEYGIVAQNAVNNLPKGGKILTKEGNYNQSTGVTGKSGIFFEGEGRGSNMSTVINWTGPANGTMFDFTDQWFFGFKNMSINGNNLAGTFLKTGAIRADGRSRYLDLTRLMINSCVGTVFDMGVGLAGRTDDTSFLDVYIEGGDIGIDGYRDHMKYFGGAISGNSTCALMSRESAGFWSYGTVFSHNASHVILQSDDYVDTHYFDGCWFENTSIDGSILKRIGIPSITKNVYPIGFKGCRLGVESILPTYAIDLTNINTELTIEGGSSPIGTGAYRTIYMSEPDSRVYIMSLTESMKWTWRGAGKVFILDKTLNHPSNLIMWWRNNNWLPLGILESNVSGSGINGAFTDNLVMNTGATSNSSNLNIKRTTNYVGWTPNRRYFTARVYFDTFSNQYIHVVMGGITNPNNITNVAEHIGFKVNGNALYGTVANGTSESILAIGTITIPSLADLEVILHPVADVIEARFWVNGIDYGGITTNIPTNNTNSNLLLSASIYNTEAVNKDIRLIDIYSMVENYWSLS